MNLGKPTRVSKLNEQMAIELGASLMGEVIIFSVAGGCLLLEYNRQVAKEVKKEDARQKQIQKFTEDIEKMMEMTLQNQNEINYLLTCIKDLASKSKHTLPDFNKSTHSDSSPTT